MKRVALRSLLALCLGAWTSYALAATPLVEYRLEALPGEASAVFQWSDGSVERRLRTEAFLTIADIESAMAVASGDAHVVKLAHTAAGAQRYLAVANRDRNRSYCVVLDAAVVQCSGFPPEQQGVYIEGETLHGEFTATRAKALVGRLEAAIAERGKRRDPAAAGPIGRGPFEVGGKALHPGCVRELLPGLPDARAVVAALDLEGCQESERYSEPYEENGRRVRFASKAVLGEGHNGAGWFEYQYLGVLTNGMHVVRTWESGGGSGVFCALLFVRREADPFYDQDHVRQRTVLRAVGQHGLGDRQGEQVKLQGNEVIVLATTPGAKPVTLRLE